MAIPVRTVLGASLVFLFARSAFAATLPYHIDSWTTEKGLPQNTVHALLQTRDGYLWLATSGGLVRFDGVTFTVFAVGAPDGLRSVRIRALLEDHTGALWIGTEHGGIARYTDGHFTTYTTTDGLPTDTVSYMHEDAQGRIWLATSEGLVCIDRGRFHTYTIKDGLPSNPISRIASDRRGNLWIGTRHGLVRLAGGRFTTYTTHDGLPDDYVIAILPARDDSLWVGTNNGLAQLQRDRVMTTYTTADGLPTNTLRYLYEDRAGNVWAGTAEGVSRLSASPSSPASRTRAVVTYAKADGLSDNVVDSILEDREGNVWIGTNTGGLNRLKTRQLAAFGRAEGLPGDGVVPITEDAQGDIWIGMTCGGLVRYRRRDETFTTFTERDGLPNPCVWSLLASRDGGLWLGTWGGGLTRFKDGRFTTYTSSNSGLSNDAVLSLYEDRAGAIWAGTLRGINRFKDDRFRVYRKEQGLGNDDVRFITEDRHGALWIGTTGGLSRFKDGTFTNYTTDQGLSYDFVRAIHESADGTLWIGTYGGGLDRLKDGRFTRYTTRDGLFENVVSRILEDDRGNFWMTGNTGIFRVRRQELDDLADGRTASVTSIAYGVPDGMRSNECNGGGQPAGWHARDGTLWFPTARGVVMIDPRRVTLNTTEPPVAIEQVLVDRRVQDRRRDIDVPPDAGDLEIQYTGLSFSAPEHVRFRYKLSGLDEHWVEAGTRRTAYYSHVPPGRYTFTVLASNGDGVWNGTGASLQLRIVPPFYRTGWFLALAAASAAGVVLITYERRIRRLTRARRAQEAFSRRLIASQEHERKRLAAELHDSVSQTLVVIKNRALLSLQTPDDPRRALDQMDEIADAASEAIDEVREISYNLRPYHLDRLGLTKAIDAMIEKAAASATDGPRFTTQLDDLDDLFPKDAEINVYRIVQEGVTNIVKHAKATEANVTIARGAHGVTITIRDNGRGFDGSGPHDASSATRGFGLIGIAERARQFGSEPLIQSAPGQGTTIHMTLTVRTQDAAGYPYSDRR
jgi:ligand-binding sensor domain-containing protein/signal transduction histidine kinase